jgi:cellobiose transport system substrate-binding protein
MALKEEEEEDKYMQFKKIVVAMMAIVVLVSLAACSKREESPASSESASGAGFGMADPESYSGTISMWSHTSAQPNFMIEHYNAVYPNVTVEFDVIPGTEHQQKVQTAVASGVDVPDIFTTKTDFITMIAASDRYYDDLLGEPYNATHLAENLAAYTVEVGSDENGALRGVTWQCPVGAIYYRRSLAKEYFGTDDPQEISDLFSSLGSIVDVARDLNERSGGEVKLIGSYDQLRGLYNSSLERPFVVGNEINLDPALIEYFETAKTLYDEDLDWKTIQSNANFAGLMENGQVFCLMSATWALNYLIMPVYPDTEGDWGLASPPVPFTIGGTWMGIYPGSENKELAYTFLNYVFSNEDFLFDYATELGDYVSNVEVQQRIGNMTPEETADLPLFKFVKNQNVYAFFNNELANGVRSELFTEYDFTITNAGVLNAAIDMYITGRKSLDEALDQYSDDLIAVYPNLVRP